MPPQTSPLMVFATVALVAGAGGLLPFSPIEPILVGIALAMPAWLAAPAIALATVCQMATKMLLFRGSTRVVSRLSDRKRAMIERVSARLAGRPWLQRGTVLVSATTGMPPLYLTTVACGALRIRKRDYFFAGAIGRTLRFSAIALLPRLLLCAVALAIPAAAHAETFVLISGTVGGKAGFSRLERQLVSEGHRVVVIDPYELSIDSADVSFAAMARRVDRVLASYHIEGARLVGHAHGAGVMLRLAAMSPVRVSALYLLDVGALAVQRSPVLSGSLRLVPIIKRIPGGRGFVRDKIIAGLRENSGRPEWLDEATQRAYTEPLLDEIGRVIAMAARLASAQEPETLDTVLSRIRVPATVLIGDAPRTLKPKPAELSAMEGLGARFTVQHLADVGHFPHEEAPAAVARIITGPVTIVVARRDY